MKKLFEIYKSDRKRGNLALLGTVQAATPIEALNEYIAGNKVMRSERLVVLPHATRAEATYDATEVASYMPERLKARIVTEWQEKGDLSYMLGIKDALLYPEFEKLFVDFQLAKDAMQDFVDSLKTDE